jgi:hypothetical protein
MHSLRSPSLGSLALVLLLGKFAAGQDLQLDAAGGSLPGTAVFDAYPSLVPFELMVIVPSTNAGPTPCSVFDPFDPRTLRIGLELVGSAFVGLAGPAGNFTVTLSIPATPALQDLGLHCQAVTLQFAPNLLDRISNPNVVRFGNAGTFRDRGVFFGPERAFATVLPRDARTWLLIGGARGQLLAQNATSSTQIYDPVDDAFTTGPFLNAPRSLHTMTQLPNGTWLIVGGVNQNNDPQATAEIYDPATDTFTPTGSMASARTGHTATLLANGKVLVTGGIQSMPTMPTQLQPIRETVATTELFDPLLGTWAAGPNLTTPRAAHAAMLRADGRVLLCGGISWDNVIILGWLPAVRRSADLYDPVTNTIAAAPQMATARSFVEPTALGGNRWLLAGGISAVTLLAPGTATAAAEIYDGTANTWTSVGSLATPRGNQRAWPLGGGQFLLAGGANGTILQPISLASCEVFSTATNLFTPGPTLTSPRAGAVTFATPQGQVMLFGGASAGGTIVGSTEWYYF